MAGLEARRKQDRLRLIVQQVTIPQVKVSELAAAAHLTPQTVGRFIRGHGITPEQEASLRSALLELLPEGR